MCTHIRTAIKLLNYNPVEGQYTFVLFFVKLFEDNCGAENINSLYNNLCHTYFVCLSM